MKSLKNKILTVLMLGVLLFVIAIPAFAAENVQLDLNKKCSIAVTLKTEDAAVADAEVTVYRIAEALFSETGVTYSYIDRFVPFGGSPNELQDTAAIGKLADYVRAEKISGTAQRTDKSGFTKFENLPFGLYLVMQTQSVKGFSDCSPFLISLPVNQAGEWVYDIDSSPKTDVVRLVDITVQKVWNDDGEHRPSSVTMQLCKQDKIIDTAVLNKENGWAYTWKDKAVSDEWAVKESVPKGYTATYSQNGYLFTVTNTAGLIHTGQLIWPIPVFAGAGVLLLAIGWYMLSRKEKDNA